MSSSRRRFLVRHPVVVDIGCGCRRPKLSSLFSFSFSKARNPRATGPFSPSSRTTTTTTTSLSPWETTTAATTTPTSAASLYEDSSSPSMVYSAAADGGRRRRGGRRRKKDRGRAAGGSVAVVKESSEPYLDFKESMLQMIVENEMYGWDDLNDLLHQLLSLNSPAHHSLILRAFTDIWDGVLSPPSPSGY